MNRKAKVWLGLGAAGLAALGLGAYALRQGSKRDPDPVAIAPGGSRRTAGTSAAEPKPAAPAGADQPWAVNAKSAAEDFGGHLASSGGYALQGEFGSALKEVGQAYKSALQGLLGG